MALPVLPALPVPRMLVVVLLLVVLVVVLLLMLFSLLLPSFRLVIPRPSLDLPTTKEKAMSAALSRADHLCAGTSSGRRSTSRSSSALPSRWAPVRADPPQSTCSLPLLALSLSDLPRIFVCGPSR